MEHTVLINYGQMAVGSGLYNRHQEPAPDRCEPGFIGGSGEQQLRRRVERHEGTNWETGSHVGVRHQWLNDRMSLIRQNFEAVVSTIPLSENAMFTQLTGSTFDEFISADRVDENVPPDPCVINFFPG
jgi:hypothetical protein